MVIVLPPRFDLIPDIGEGQEPILVQALDSEFAAERLDERVVSGFAGPTWNARLSRLKKSTIVRTRIR